MRLPVRSTLSVILLAALIPALLPAPATAAPATAAGSAVNTEPSAAIDAYWTPERMAAARPMPAPAAGIPARDTEPDGPARTVPAVAPKTGIVVNGPSVWVTIGRLWFNVPGSGDYICSANVVASNNRDVIATARHCVMNIDTGAVYRSFRFAPAYNRGNAPYGWWNWRSVGWRTDDRGPGGDTAFMVLATGGNAGRHVQEVVGGTGLGFNWSTNNYARGLGLPGDKDYAVWCEGQPYDGPSGGVQIRNCVGLAGGASGGAFIVNYQPSDGSAYQTASYFGSWGDSYFAYWRDVAWNIYNGAQNA
ncbi:peptidase [Virgisporangium aliadipatigenens]|uniref:Peptidase n=1 Tax=Virgisporangium aliadipatigenens TaxID=741659 RepID=A0A8J3YKZ9_9ACTN|nr:hypothetical protein [Virgisporangium aliadipatigenens]GIJ47399.1 peptidase [Virgisporangium aliadipatigenens]